MLYSMPRAYRTGSRRATSHAGSPPAASSKTRAELRRAWRARPHARGRRQGRRACWRLWQALTCQKTPRSARDVTKAARLGAARAAGRHRHQARGRRAPPNRQGRRGSREHSTDIPFLWRVNSIAQNTHTLYVCRKMNNTGKISERCAGIDRETCGLPTLGQNWRLTAGAGAWWRRGGTERQASPWPHAAHLWQSGQQKPPKLGQQQQRRPALLLHRARLAGAAHRAGERRHAGWRPSGHGGTI